MIDDEIEVKVLSNEELSLTIDELSENLSRYHLLLWDCIKEREQRYSEQVQYLQRIIDNVKGTVLNNDSSSYSLINYPNMSTANSTVSDNNSTTKELRKSSHVHSKRKVEIEETITDSTNTIGDSSCSYRQINNDRYCVGIDCRG